MIFELHTAFPQGLAEEWNDLLDRSITKVPFLRYEYLSGWWDTRGGGEWPQAELRLVTARQDGRLVGAAALMQARHEGQPALMLVGSIEISDYLDLVVEEPNLPAFADGLLAFLRSPAFPGGWERLSLYNIPDDSPSLAALQAAARRAGAVISAEAESPCPYITLPGDWESYLAGIDKKQRHEIRRKIRRAESAEQPVNLYVSSAPERIEQDIEDCMRLMAMDAEKERFLTPAMRVQFKNCLSRAFEGGYLQLAFLEVGGEKAAVYANFLFNRRVLVYNSGMDTAFSEVSPGWVLLGYLLQGAIEQGMQEFDFMRGNEDYKYRFGAVDRQVLRVEIQFA